MFTAELIQPSEPTGVARSGKRVRKRKRMGRCMTSDGMPGPVVFIVSRRLQSEFEMNFYFWQRWTMPTFKS